MDERGILEAYLRERGQKMTKPREAVLDAFLRIERHVTAEELFDAVRGSEPGIGQATVFRTLKILEGAGLARQALADDGPKRYEHAFRHEHHDHLVCTGCGRTVEFMDQDIERAQASVYRKNGFQPGGHLLELFGLCPKCLKK